MSKNAKKCGFPTIIMWYFQTQMSLEEFNFRLTFKSRMRIKNLIPTLIMLFPLLTFSQIQISGEVYDTNDKPISFANVVLFDADNQLIAGEITNDDGEYFIKTSPGNYILQISFIGYKKWNDTIEVTKDINLGKINLNDDPNLLNEVTIKGKKPLIEREVDRLVFNVENSIASQGMSALDALSNTPLVRIQNENVSIVGKGNIILMINDRILHLSGNELTSYLQSLRSDNIASIEVITTPPSRYSAQGNSGIINIILKKNQNLGWNGNLNSSYQKTSYDGFGSGATINYQSNSISSSLKLRQNEYSVKPVGSRNLIGENNSIYTSEVRKDNSETLGLNYSFDLKINKNQNIGVIYDFNNRNQAIDASGISRYESHGAIDSILSTFQQQRWETSTHTLNAYYDIQLDTTGKRINITGNYLRNSPDKVNDFETISDNGKNASIVRNSSYLDYNIYSGQADITLPYQFGTVESGIKYTSFENNSNVDYYNVINSNYVIDPEKSNAFDYNEKNYAAYISWQKDFNDQWSAKSGLRYEYTTLIGTSPEQNNDIINNSYGRLFPTAYVQYQPSMENSFTLSYSKRIDRPSFQSLNPFRWYTNPYTYFTGTPTLRPTFSDNLEFTYTFRNKLSSSFYYQYSKNGISNIARLNNGIYTNVIENSFDENKLGLQINYNDRYFNAWEISFSATGTYTATEPIIQEAEGLNVNSFSYSLYNTITLNTDETWFLLLNYWHDLPYVYANINIESQLNFSPGVKASFLNKKLTASAVITDLFKTFESNGYSYNSGYRSEFTSYFDRRRLVISLSYSFGNNKVNGNKKNIQFNEKSRAN
ncbi:outer membrane beta-barrel family protein [Zunongwangia sp. F363]|uniref:Outer membrane beta-barrel family protein n=1 Tax=Autumnicola tepida TaxID=3075595 RepID=A0ABU3C5H2_9FLAO|nr:outer membrane beta-barrel family protein [Zunongwangia sp. F363]MDT0641584.1 outer membrane beta-barrel family protein [Zunongwangia sp. F363]